MFLRNLNLWLLCIGLLLAVACDGGGDDEGSDLPAGWTQAEKDEFLSNCEEDDGDSEYCECYFDGISEKYSKEEYENLSFSDLLSESLSIGLACI